MPQSDYPYLVCDDCGLEANRLTCLKKYGAEPLKPKFTISTYHLGICEVCGKEKGVTESRDFFHPDFSLLTQPGELLTPKENDRIYRNNVLVGCYASCHQHGLWLVYLDRFGYLGLVERKIINAERE